MVTIELKTIKSLSTNIKYDILLSCSLFMMKEAYRKFPEYVMSFMNWFPRIPRNTCVRMYIDDSVLENKEFQKILDMKSPNLEIVQYYCKEFFDEDSMVIKSKMKIASKSKSVISRPIDTVFPKGYHDGTFGSIIRLLPLFEKPANVKYIWITDTDMPIKVFNYKFIKAMQENNAKVFYYSKSCYDKPWSEGINYPIGAGRIIMSSKVDLNKGNFTRFLNDVAKGKYQTIFDSIKKYYEGTFRDFNNIKLFPYGFDELFTNKYLYPIFKQHKRIISFEIGLPKEFLKENIITIDDKKKKKAYTEAYFKSWAWKLKQDEYNFLLKTMNELFEQTKQLDFTKIKPERASQLRICLRDYEENKDKVNLTSEDVGISSWIIKKPNEE
jgi:hypothetical protein